MILPSISQCQTLNHKTIKTMNTEKLAGILYETYCRKVGGKAFNGDPLPDWNTFRGDPAKTKQSDAWVATAAIAQETITNSIPAEKS